MTDHYHLHVETPHPTLARGMRGLNGIYTQCFNRRHGRPGRLFQGRYTAVLVERDSYLLELCRYVVLNPVRARMVGRSEDWPWSLYRATAGIEPAPAWLHTPWTLSRFGQDEPRATYAYFVAEGAAATSLPRPSGTWSTSPGGATAVRPGAATGRRVVG
jgi:hypothetical protein